MKRRVFLTVVVCFSILAMVNVQAQSIQTYVGTYSIAPLQRTWSWDGTYFSFMNPDLGTELSSWVNVNVISGDVKQGLSVPYAYGLPEAHQKKLFGFYSGANQETLSGISTYYPSPDQKIAVFRGTPSNGWKFTGIASPVSFINLQTEKSYTLDLPIFGGELGNDYAVYWSLHSNASIIITISPYTAKLIYYITEINLDLNLIKSQIIIDDLKITKVLKNPLTDVFGISEFGDSILVSTRENLQKLNIITYVSEVIDSFSDFRSLRTAILSNDQNIHYVINENLYIYNSSTRVTQLKSLSYCFANINNRGNWLISLSPTGKTASLVIEQRILDRDSVILLYLCNLEAIPYSISIPTRPNIIVPPAQPTLINPLPGGGGE
jgi:hypothetical protein